jgi:hypothetical protein
MLFMNASAAGAGGTGCTSSDWLDIALRQILSNIIVKQTLL